MSVRVTILEYLDKLKKIEREKLIEEQLRVPNLTQLARAIGISRVSYSKYANNRGTNISRRLTGETIRILRKLGHDTQLQDILQYVEY